jgi:spermidine/putrescine transport system permease protein
MATGSESVSRGSITTRFVPFVGRRSLTEFLAAPLSWLALFLVVPMVIMVAFSFLQVQNYDVVFEPTLQNYVALLTSGLFRHHFLNTVQIAVIVTVVALLIGYPLAYAIAYKAKRPNVWLLLVLGPFFTVYLIRVFSWFMVLGRNGLINIVLQRLGLIQSPIGWLLYSKFAVIVGLVHAFLPYLVLTIYATLQGLDPDELEAARDLGASPFRAFLDVTLPQSLPGIITGSLFVFIPSFGAYVTPKLLGGGRVEMIAPLLESYMHYTLDISKAAAGGMLMLVVVIVVTAVIFWIVNLEELFSGSAGGPEGGAGE